MQPHRRQPTRLPRPWDSLGKNTGVGCHFLLRCIKVKSESEVTQLCQTPSDPRDCSLPGSSVHGIFQAKVLEWVSLGKLRELVVDREAWGAAVHRVTKSQTWLSGWTELNWDSAVAWVHYTAGGKKPCSSDTHRQRKTSPICSPTLASSISRASYGTHWWTEMQL